MISDAYSYSDVYLIPCKSILKSRSDADTELFFGRHKFKLPVVPANMRCVISEDLSEWFSKNGYFYIMHRFDVDYNKFTKRAMDESWKISSISLGIKDFDTVEYEHLVKNVTNGSAKLDYVTIDIAHGHTDCMVRALRILKQDLPEVFVKAGNVATARAAQDLEEWGADAVKCGIGGGAACSTRFKTGFNVPMFSCVQDCSRGVNIPVIADGGVVQNGDIAKALVAGATMVMCGGTFASCKDSPTEYVEDDLALHGYRKIYYGSASERNKGYNRHIEGMEISVDGNGMTYNQKLNEIEEDLSSAISYAGGVNLEAFSGVGFNCCR